MLKKVLIITLVLIFSMISISYGALSFSDVPKNYWAYNDIDFSSQKGIIKGFPDNTFKPAYPVTKEQSIAMIYRTLAAAGKLKESTDLSSEYADILNADHISSWATSYIAYALKYKIITENELTTFNKKMAEGNPASRQEVAVWTGRAADKNLAPAYIISYSDKKYIAADAIGYVDLLYRQGIMIGDNNNNFRPSATITRAEFAAICSRVFKMESNTNFDAAKEVSTYNGVIKSVDYTSRTITIVNSKGVTKQFTMAPGANILLNGQTDHISAIKQGTQAIIAFGTFSDDNQIIVWTDEVILNGTLEEVKELGGNYYSVRIQNRDGDSITYLMDSNSEILNSAGKQTTMDYLTAGSDIRAIFDGIKILEIQID